MKALVYTEPYRTQYRDWDEPEPGPNQALLVVEATGVCGSDMAGYQGRSSRRKPPLILGHEVVGTALSAPKGSGLQPGDRVVANPLQSCGHCRACLEGHQNLCDAWRLLGMDSEQGGFAERVVVDAPNLARIPTDMPVEMAVMVEPFANSVHVMGIASQKGAETLLIVGAGTQGILALMLARHLGHTQIAVAETNPARLELAGRLGAALCINPLTTDIASTIRSWAPGGVDLALEAVGASTTRMAAVGAVKKGGRVILLGLHDQTGEADYAAIVRNEIELVGSFAYTHADFARSLELLSTGSIDPKPYVRSMRLQDGQQAMEFLSGDPGAVLKVMLVP